MVAHGLADAGAVSNGVQLRAFGHPIDVDVAVARGVGGRFAVAVLVLGGVDAIGRTVVLLAAGREQRSKSEERGKGRGGRHGTTNNEGLMNL